MKAGDIVFVRGTSPISYAVRLFDKGTFSHVGVAVSDNHVIEAEYSTKVRISEMHYKSYEVVDLGLSDAERDLIVHKAIDNVGKWYDYTQILGYFFSNNTFFGSPNALICSELVYDLLKEVSIDVGSRFIKPNELYRKLKNISA